MGRNVYDHDHASCLGHVYDHEKKLEPNGNLECEKQYELQEKGRLSLVK